MDNQHYARILQDIASLLAIRGDNRYRIRAFEDAAETISRLGEPLEQRLEAGTVEQLQGIGESIADDLRQIHDTGTCELRDTLLDELDPGLLELLEIQGLGPKRVAKIYEQLDITSIDALREAAESGWIAELSGFGAKTQQSILEEIERLDANRGRTPLPTAEVTANSLVDELADLDAIDRLEVAGSLRRGRETVGDIDILVATDAPADVADAFIDLRQVGDVIQRGDTRVSVHLLDGLQVDLRLIDHDVFGAALHYFTGSKQHHIQMRSRAKQMDLKISEYGVFATDADDADDTADPDTADPDAADPLASETEADVFDAVDLPYIPPEIREGDGEIDAAERDDLPDLVEPSDIRGDIHMHTTETDGSNSIEQMGRAARDLGHEYIAITDHSQAVRVADGMTPDRFEAHIDRIHNTDDEVDGIRLLAGIEVDILEDGSLDMDHDLLAACDWVVGSIHEKFNLPADAMTDRLRRAIETDLLDCLGHPTGRILGGRDGYDYDTETIFEACVEHDVAMELNGSSGRLDLNAERARAAHNAGVPLVLGSDAHSTGGLDQISYAIQQARRAWLEPDDIVNTRPATKIAN